MNSNPAINTPGGEQIGHLARFASRCRQMRWFGALFHVGVAQDIAADDAAKFQRIGKTAAEAERFDTEALAQIEQAQRPDSDGGRVITPREMRKIKPLIVKSALLDGEANALANS